MNKKLKIIENYVKIWYNGWKVLKIDQKSWKIDEKQVKNDLNYEKQC